MRVKYKLDDSPFVIRSINYKETECQESKDLEDSIISYFLEEGIGDYHVDAISMHIDVDEIVLGVYNCEKTVEGEIVYADSEIVRIENLQDIPLGFIEEHRDGIEERFELPIHVISMLHRLLAKVPNKL